jgi:hypothetical protein
MHLSFWKKDQKPKQRSWVDEGAEGISGPGMNTQGILSIVALILGVVVLAVLTALGGVAKQQVHDGIMSRLKYKLPDGYKNDPDYHECYRSTKGMFYDEYYLWNLTNKAEFLSGTPPHFNLTGPYVYPQWYCNYNHSIDEEAGILRYRTSIEGYRFIREQSVTDDDVLITNINPAYAGIMQLVGGSETNLQFVLSGGAIETIIETLQAPTTILAVQLSVWGQGAASILEGVEVKTTITVASTTISQLPTPQFWDPSFVYTSPQGLVVYGWAYYTLQRNSTADVTLPSAAQSQIFTAWSTPTGLGAFSSLNASQVVSAYGVSADQAAWLLTYVENFLLDPTTYGTYVFLSAQSAVLGQWANGSLSSTSLFPYGGWEIGLQKPSNISVADAAIIFDPSSPCSLTSSSGVQLWVGAVFQAVNVLQVCPQYTLSQAQYQAILSWIQAFTSTVASPLLLGKFGLPDWSEFGYAQWGGTVTGTPLLTPEGWAPEISSNFPGCQFSPSEAQRILNGTVGLFDYTNMVGFLQLVLAQDFTDIGTYYGISPSQAVCIGLYVQSIIVPYAVIPAIQEAKDKGSGLLVTRTVNEWLFNAFDPLLTLLQQNNDTSLVGNKTISEAQANQRDYTMFRIYTGHNDLYWSLMPYNEGTVLDFWRGGNVTITGYNGTQFLPYNEINKANPGGHPLLLFHHLINRTVPFVNQGKDKWDGVNVRYLTLDPLALASDAINPANYPYYATYNGLINKTSNPPYLPVFLSPADFHTAEAAVTENITFSDLIFTDFNPDEKMSRHRLSLFLLVEPELGSTVWGNLPIQMNLRYYPVDDPTHEYRDINTGFAPIYWNAIGNIASKSDLDDVKNQLYANQRAWKALIGVGVGAGVLIMVGGIIGLHHYKKHKNELIDSSTIDSTTTSPKSSSATVSAYTG